MNGLYFVLQWYFNDVFSEKIRKKIDPLIVSLCETLCILDKGDMQHIRMKL